MRLSRGFLIFFLVFPTVLIATIGYSVSTVDADARAGRKSTLPQVPPMVYAEASAEANSSIGNGFYNVYAKVLYTDNDASNYSGGCSETAYQQGPDTLTATASACVDGYSSSVTYYQDSDSASHTDGG